MEECQVWSPRSQEREVKEREGPQGLTSTGLSEDPAKGKELICATMDEKAQLQWIQRGVGGNL